jgi:hypothetical protein
MSDHHHGMINADSMGDQEWTATAMTIEPRRAPAKALDEAARHEMKA